MNIEFQTPYKKVSEKLISEIRNEIMEILKDSLLVHSRKETFEKAAKETLKELKRLVNQQMNKLNKVPEKNLS